MSMTTRPHPEQRKAKPRSAAKKVHSEVMYCALHKTYGFIYGTFGGIESQAQMKRDFICGFAASNYRVVRVRVVELGRKK